MSSTDVSAASSTGASARPSRSALQPDLGRRLLARNVGDAGAAARQARRSIWISSVDLPMPGSPPSRIDRAAHEATPGDAVEFADAGDQARCVVGARRSGISRAKTLPRPRGRCEAGTAAIAEVSSAIEFHSPQASHLPCQR